MLDHCRRIRGDRGAGLGGAGGRDP